MEQLGGKTENELWLERMNQMQKDELQLIGSGGFGRVYKFKEKSASETHVAVKIVKRTRQSERIRLTGGRFRRTNTEW